MKTLLSEHRASTKPEITAVVADDSPLFLQAVCRKLRTQGRIRVIAAVKNGLEAVRETTLLRPSMVLLDVHMPEMSGPEAAAIIHANYPQVSVVLMSSAEIDEVEQRCNEVGANAFILKHDLLDRITADTDAVKTSFERRSRRPRIGGARCSTRQRAKSQ